MEKEKELSKEEQAIREQKAELVKEALFDKDSIEYLCKEKRNSILDEDELENINIDNLISSMGSYIDSKIKLVLLVNSSREAIPKKCLKEIAGGISQSVKIVNRQYKFAEKINSKEEFLSLLPPSYYSVVLQNILSLLFLLVVRTEVLLELKKVKEKEAGKLFRSVNKCIRELSSFETFPTQQMEVLFLLSKLIHRKYDHLVS